MNENRSENEKQPAWKHITENVECLAIAIVMALMLKFFLIEAYKIPTGSMQPTIMGNAEIGLFDRVLVNKFIYLLNEPDRWDIIVFKYPLDQSKNYIKRLIGLPGEQVVIRDGDIYINGKIERKPESAQDAVLKQIFPAGAGIRDVFDLEGSVRVEGLDCITFEGPGKASTRHTIRTRYLDGYDPDYGIRKPERMYLDEDQCVGDLRLSFEATLADAKGGLFARIEEEGREHLLFLKGAENTKTSYLATGRNGGSEPEVDWRDQEFHLQSGRTYRICFSNIDDRLTLHVDGDHVASIDYDYQGLEPPPRSNRVEFGVEGKGSMFDEIRLWRDIYYISDPRNTQPVEYPVPPGHYFALGDNTQNSADSRLWKAVVFELKNGEVIRGNYDPHRQATAYRENYPQRGPDGIELRDTFGDTIVLSYTDLKDTNRGYDSEDAHFIPEKLLLGKAMVVFWPVYPHFRWKLLR